METKMTEQESLKIITEMIGNSRAKIRDNGFFYLLWGWMMLSASILNFALIMLDYDKAWLPWPLLMAAGLVVTLIAGFRMGRTKRVRTYFDTAMIFLWWAFFVVLMIVLFMAGRGIISWTAADALIISLYGLATFVSGGLLRFKPLLYGGLFAWIFSILILYVPGIYSVLIVAASIVVAYLIPGYMLKNRYKNQSHV